MGRWHETRAIAAILLTKLPSPSDLSPKEPTLEHAVRVTDEIANPVARQCMYRIVLLLEHGLRCVSVHLLNETHGHTAHSTQHTAHSLQHIAHSSTSQAPSTKSTEH
jgi:hypothetical protein